MGNDEGGSVVVECGFFVGWELCFRGSGQWVRGVVSVWVEARLLKCRRYKERRGTGGCFHACLVVPIDVVDLRAVIREQMGYGFAFADRKGVG